MQTTKNRWLIAACAVGIHISIGSVYSWSVFTKPLKNQFGWDDGQVSLAFSLAILFLGLSAAFLGPFVERNGPRRAGLLAAVFFGIGMIGSGLAVQAGSLTLLYLFYGGLGGIGLGVGYIAPVSSLVKWFPDRRGLATGLAIMGFGFASLISGPIMARLIGSTGIAPTFYILGTVYFLLMVGSSLYLAPPPQGWMPEGFQKQIEAGTRRPVRDMAQLTAKQALKTRRFYFLWLMLFINVTCGIAIISVASPMAQEIAGLSVLAAAAMVGLMGLFNGIGRIGWASLSDYIGRPNTYTAFFTIQLVAFFLLPHTTQPLLFQGLVFLILTCYGGGFASIPAYIGDLFGTRELGAIHGNILTAWAAAGLAGPAITSWIRDTTGSYAGSLSVFAAFFAVALIISLWIQVDIRRLRQHIAEQGT
ncbi:OFA family oxalate/formate antiporter-like MFS transporter [Melghirimyces profundicolus]|uniref:OFA family oxalate/formate antiporter-like MFS transporter n=1 Tax=Melghirimyces profundicolus TaxID=1242148 RepID=A0A2T6C9J1_9BACL|nr:OFA family MFS transporter [Melghirimyces profundicolus]PTX64970.1 OFA family oxalate/formate antiporter-like MFS transporter [Melghirimyces profundicolus]